MNGANPFFDRAYAEATALLVETRNYVAHREAADHADLCPVMRLEASVHALRVTARLTQVMAWMLAQRAAHDGDLTPEEALGDAFAISGGEVCADPAGADDERLPPGLRSLLARSHGLYMRTRRLERMMRDELA